MNNKKNDLPAVLGGRKAIITKKPTWPVVTESIIDAVTAALREGYLSQVLEDSHITKLERKFSEYHSMAYALAVGTGTAALDSAMYAVGVEPADEVITSAICPGYVVTPILHMNAIPVFADVDPLTGTIDPDDIEKHITNRTKAIMVVHLSGQMADMDPIMDIANRHDLKVIEDCAHAQGSSYKGRLAGTIGDIGAFSIQSNKNLACGEGGVILTSDKDLYEKCRSVYWVRNNEYHIYDMTTYFGNGLGWNYRMTLMSAVIALAQMKTFDKTMELRRKNAVMMNDYLDSIPGFHGTYVAPNRVHTYFDQLIHYDIEALGLPMQAVMEALRAEGIEARPVDVPVYNAAIFRDKEFYGKGCPWNCPFNEGQKHDYRNLHLPKTEEMFCSTIRTLSGGIVVDDPAIAQEHAEAFRKISRYSEEIFKAWNNRSLNGELTS